MERFTGLIWTLALTLVAILLQALVWPAAIEYFVFIQPIGEKTLTEWVSDFRLWGFVGVGFCCFFAILWQILGEFHWKVVSSGVSLTWGVLAVASAAVSVLPGAFLLAPAENSLAAFGFYVIHFVLVFGVSTICFSPPTVMFVPPGSKYLRR